MTACDHSLGVDARVCAWEDLPPSGDFDTRALRRTPAPARARSGGGSARMAGALRPGGSLVLTSRSWDREQPSESYGSERSGRRARVTYAWSEDDVDITVTVGGETVAERLTFSHDELLAGLQAAGLEPCETTFTPDVDRHLVTARRF